MATKFKYEAKDQSGKLVKGSVSAENQADAVADLRRRNLTPIDVTKSGGWFGGGGGPKTKTKKPSKPKPK